MRMASGNNQVRPADMYRLLLGSRLAEEKIVQLCATGELAAHHSGLNHEAIGVGVGLAVEFDDCVQPSYRSGAALMHARQGGLSLRDLIFQGYGLIPGPRAQHSGGPRTLRSTGIVGGQIPMANGIAMANKLRGSKRAVLSFIGDGASNEGPVHEAMNIAGVKRLPIIFIVENNGMALSTRGTDSTAAARLADRGAGYGIQASTVDGRDPAVVMEAASIAIERAREDNLPSLLEIRISRPGPHVTVIRDVRTDDELHAAKADDCVTAFRARLSESQQWDDHAEAALLTELTGIIDAAVEEARGVRRDQAPDARPAGPSPARYSEAEAWRLAYVTPAPRHLGE